MVRYKYILCFFPNLLFRHYKSGKITYPRNVACSSKQLFFFFFVSDCFLKKWLIGIRCGIVNTRLKTNFSSVEKDRLLMPPTLDGSLFWLLQMTTSYMKSFPAHYLGLLGSICSNRADHIRFLYTVCELMQKRNLNTLTDRRCTCTPMLV